MALIYGFLKRLSMAGGDRPAGISEDTIPRICLTFVLPDHAEPEQGQEGGKQDCDCDNLCRVDLKDTMQDNLLQHRHDAGFDHDSKPRQQSGCPEPCGQCTDPDLPKIITIIGPVLLEDTVPGQYRLRSPRKDQVFQYYRHTKYRNAGKGDRQGVIARHRPDVITGGPLDKPEERVRYI